MKVIRGEQRGTKGARAGKRGMVGEVMLDILGQKKLFDKCLQLTKKHSLCPYQFLPLMSPNKTLFPDLWEMKRP